MAAGQLFAPDGSPEGPVRMPWGPVGIHIFIVQQNGSIESSDGASWVFSCQLGVLVETQKKTTEPDRTRRALTDDSMDPYWHTIIYGHLQHLMGIIRTQKFQPRFRRLNRSEGLAARGYFIPGGASQRGGGQAPAFRVARCRTRSLVDIRLGPVGSRQGSSGFIGDPYGSVS